MYYTKEYLKEQVFLDGWFLGKNGIPDELKTDEICQIAVENAHIRTSNSESILYYVPPERRSYALCLSAVKKDGAAIRDVPQKHRTRELCLEAVRFEGGELIEVPTELRDKTMCELAVASNGWAIFDVPRSLWSGSLLKLAVRNAPNLIKTLPEEVVTDELRVMARRRLEMEAAWWSGTFNV